MKIQSVGTQFEKQEMVALFKAINNVHLTMRNACANDEKHILITKKGKWVTHFIGFIHDAGVYELEGFVKGIPVIVSNINASLPNSYTKSEMAYYNNKYALIHAAVCTLYDRCNPKGRTSSFYAKRALPDNVMSMLQDLSLYLSMLCTRLQTR